MWILGLKGLSCHYNKIDKHIRMDRLKQELAFDFMFTFPIFCRPRLGTALHRVLGVGGLYFVLAAIEGCFRSLHVSTH